MFPDYSTFKTYHRLTNRYATLGDTTKLPIEGIGTEVHTLNGRTILTHTLYTLLHYEDHYIHSVITVNDHGVVSTPHIMMDHNYFYQTSSYKWKTHMTTYSATSLSVHHIKVPSTT